MSVITKENRRLKRRRRVRAKIAGTATRPRISVFRSNRGIAAQLIDDVNEDTTRFELFYSTAVQVLDLDRKRNATMAHMSELSPRERADAVARMQENALIVQWVQQCLERRVSSYRWALERLVLQAPDGMAADADRLIGALAAQTANPPIAAQPPVIGRALTTRG